MSIFLPGLLNLICHSFSYRFSTRSFIVVHPYCSGWRVYDVSQFSSFKFRSSEFSLHNSSISTILLIILLKVCITSLFVRDLWSVNRLLEFIIKILFSMYFIANFLVIQHILLYQLRRFILSIKHILCK